MPKTESILQVFVASPGDLGDERGALEDVVRELNATWSRTLNCRLELVRWETHAVPGIGADPQDVINRTLPQDYDIFIGMLWTRFGTPTSRADSGTAEEFEQALARHLRDPVSVDIVFYFKEAPVSPSEIDPEQLAKIKAFRRQLGDRALYSTFQTVEEFQNLARIHLSRLAQKWATPISDQLGPVSSAGNSQEPLTVRTEPDREDEGLLDLLDQTNDAVSMLTELAERMAATIGDLGSKIAERSAELDALNPQSGSYNVKAAKRISTKAAANLDEYVARTEVDIPIFAEALSTAMRSFGRAASISLEFDREDVADLESARDELSSLRDTLAESAAGLESLRGSIAATPRITSDYNRAKRRALATMESLLREFQVGIGSTNELVASLEEIITSHPTRSAQKSD